MRNPKLISLGYAVPTFTFTQDDIFKTLGYPHGFSRIFNAAQIDRRHFVVPIQDAMGRSFQEQQELYQVHAVDLSTAALAKALDGKSSDNLGLLTYSTCTGFAPGPTVSDFLAQVFHLPSDLEVNNLSSQGCESSFPGLKRCYDFTALHGKPSAAIACELCSLTYYPEPEGHPDPENDYEVLRAMAIFGDAASCAILGFDDNPRHPEILDFVSHLDTSYIKELGYVWRDGRLRVKLSKSVPDIAVKLVTIAIKKLLERNSLEIADIAYWVIHPPGAIVLDKLRDTLPLPEEKLKYSRKALRENGNCSSATVGIVGKLLMQEETNPQGYLIMANVGPGMCANASLMRFGVS